MNLRGAVCQKILDECLDCYTGIKDFNGSSCVDDCSLLRSICRHCEKKCEREIK